MPIIACATDQRQMIHSFREFIQWREMFHWWRLWSGMSRLNSYWTSNKSTVTQHSNNAHFDESNNRLNVFHFHDFTFLLQTHSFRFLNNSLCGVTISCSALNENKSNSFYKERQEINKKEAIIFESNLHEILIPSIKKLPCFQSNI